MTFNKYAGVALTLGLASLVGGCSGGGGSGDTGTDAARDASDVIAADNVNGVDAGADASDGMVATDAAMSDGRADASSDAVAIDASGTDAGGSDGGATDVVLTDATPVDGGASCRLAVAGTLVPGVTTVGTIAAGSPDRVPAGGSCGGDGPEQIYLLRVPTAGSYAISTAWPETTLDTVLRLRRACESDVGEVCEDDLRGGETASFIEPVDLEAGDYYVIVDTFGPSASGTFGVRAFQPAPAYNDSVIPRACDDMGTAPLVAGVTGDNTASAILPLPFAFRLGTVPQTHYSVSSNGFAQLWPSAAGTPSTESRATEIPYPSAPNGIIAPFWDDLTTVPGGGTDVRARSVGAGAAAHFTIQWTNWRFPSSDATRLTFQAMLFQTTGVIEFHYCTVTPGSETDRAGGSNAAIGVEDNSGHAGGSAGYHVPGNVDGTRAFRFSPL